MKKNESIKELDWKGMLLLEFIDEFDKYHSFKYPVHIQYELKTKIKEFKKTGCMTFITIENNTVRTEIFEPKFLRVTKILSAFKREENTN
jgi:hypothetical protein